jgi:hypothetical protein
MIYKGNPKHKEPWQRGRKGALCSREFPVRVAQELLQGSVLVGKKRYASHGGIAYCAQGNESDTWHGYPIGWGEVPEQLRSSWKQQDLVTRKQIRDNW